MWNWELALRDNILLHCIFLLEVQISGLKKEIQNLISLLLIGKDIANFQNGCLLREAFLLASGPPNGREYNFHLFLHHLFSLWIPHPLLMLHQILWMALQLKWTFLWILLILYSLPIYRILLIVCSHSVLRVISLSNHWLLEFLGTLVHNICHLSKS